MNGKSSPILAVLILMFDPATTEKNESQSTVHQVDLNTDNCRQQCLSLGRSAGSLKVEVCGAAIDQLEPFSTWTCSNKNVLGQWVLDYVLSILEGVIKSSPSNREFIQLKAFWPIGQRIITADSKIGLKIYIKGKK